ncbi:MAG: cytochrome c oxidase subunit 3 [SAR324 cluster bacterium]|nr:cytochrome c oxidase subunit 3 [SAR324 cluster bacterium]
MLIGTNVDPTRHQNRQKPPIANGVVGIAIFVVTEVMFFASLISAYLVLRSGAEEWPPWGQPRLPVAATAFNTVVLLLSGLVLFKAYQQFLKPDRVSVSRKMLGLSILLGLFFVLFQGYEWIQLLQFGLTMTSSNYGGLFYLIIGTHAVHVVAALFFLLHTYSMLAPSRIPQLASTEFVVSQIFWYFVVGVWPILYFLIYLV